MEGASHSVGVELREIEGFLDDPLAGKCRVAMDLDHHAMVPGSVTGAILAGPHPSQRHWIDELEVAWIEAEREVHAPAVGRLVVGGVSEVILDVTAADMKLGIHVGKLPEDPLRTLPHDVCQHIEPAAVGHRHHHVVNLLTGRPLDRHLQQRNQALRSLQREAFCPQKSLLDELLEYGRRGHLPVDAELLPAVELNPVFTALHSHLQPLPHPEVVHVHELHTNRATVGVPQSLDDLPQRHRLRPFDRVGRERPVHVLVRQVVERRIELRQPGPRATERVDLGHQMAADTVRPHQLVHPILQERHPLFARGASGHRQGQRHLLARGRSRQTN